MKILDYSELNEKLIIESIKQKKQEKIEKIKHSIEEIIAILYFIFLGIFILSL